MREGGGGTRDQEVDQGRDDEDHRRAPSKEREERFVHLARSGRGCALSGGGDIMIHANLSCSNAISLHILIHRYKGGEKRYVSIEVLFARHEI